MIILKKITTLMILCCFFSFLFSQITEKQVDNRLKKAYSLGQSQKRNESLKILLETLEDSKKIGYKKGILNSYTGLMMHYSYIGDYKKVLEIAHDAEKIAVYPEDIEKLAYIHMNKGIAYEKTGFLDEGLKELNKAVSYNKNLPDKEYGYFQLSVCYQNISSLYEMKKNSDSVLHYLHKSVAILEKTDNKFDKEYKNSGNIIFANMNIANYYMGVSNPPKIDSAEIYISKILKYENTQAFNSNKLVIANTLATFYNIKEDFKKAVFYANEVLALEKDSHRPDKRRDAYFTLSSIYEGMGNKELQLKYLKLYTTLDDSLTVVMQSDFKNSAKQITSTKDKEHDDNIKEIWIRVICCFVILFIIFVVFWIRYVKKTKERYETIINSFKENINIPIPPTEEQISLQKEINIEKNKPTEITEATVKSILVFLDEFEKTNEFTKSDVNLSYLANYANTNTKYLNEVLKNYKGKSFSKYINGLRINYIMKLLYVEPKYREYKISYLAELCGFSSREVFSSVFKKETDITTSYYINQLRNEPETVVDKNL